MGFMDLFVMGGSIKVNGDEASGEIDKVTGKAREGESKMTGAFKKIGTAVVAAFAIDKIIDFGKETVETTAKVQALDSQFTQTFKDNGDKAMEMINKQSKDQNINVDRLRGTWASFYGTMRGGGADANQSLDLTNKYLNLAADGAAYYDLSLEDVTSRLKSMTLGNFEAGDAIGVNLNVTKLDIEAKKKYGKAWQDLTDTEKSFLVVDTVGKIYESNGAMGQAQREGKSYSNVMENLKATWQRFLSIIGAPVLSGVINVMQTLNDIIAMLVAKMQSFNPADFVAGLKSMFSPEFVNSMGFVVQWFQRLIDLIKTDAADNFAGSLTQLQDVFIMIGEALQPVIEGAFTVLADVFGVLLAAIDTLIPYFAFLKNVLLDLVIVFIGNVSPSINAIAEAFTGMADELVMIWTDWILPTISQFIDMITQLYYENQDKLALLGELFRVVAQFIADRVLWMINMIQTYVWPFIMAIVGFISDNMNTIKRIFQGVLDAIGGILNIFIGIFTGNWSRAWDGVKQTFSGIWEAIKAAFKLAVDAISAVWDGITSKLTSPIEAAKSTISGIVEKIKTMFANIFPDIKTPHFEVKNWSANPLDWVTKGNPYIDVAWYAKGGIFTQPTVLGGIGVGDANNGKGSNAEAVLPIDKLPELLKGTGVGGVTQILNFYGDTSSPAEVARQTKKASQKMALGL